MSGLHWPPQPAYEPHAGQKARHPKPAPKSSPRPGRSVRARLGLEVSGARLAYPIGTVCSLDKRWERP
jgi:hypothetical protein